MKVKLLAILILLKDQIIFGIAVLVLLIIKFLITSAVFVVVVEVTVPPNVPIPETV